MKTATTATRLSNDCGPQSTQSSTYNFEGEKPESSHSQGLDRWQKAFALTIYVFLFFTALHYTPFATAEYQLLDKVVAIVEDDIILASELNAQVNTVTNNLRQQNGRIPKRETLVEQVLERKILESLQLQRAEQIGMRISDQELNDAVASVAANNNLSIAEFRKAVEQQGESYTELRERIRNEMLIREVQRRSVLRNIVISESEVENFLASEQGQAMLQQEINIEHILLAVGRQAPQAQRDSAKQAIKSLRLQATEANSFSAITAQAGSLNANVSSLGWRKMDAIPSLFTDLVGTLSVGEVSPIIESDSGFHLIRIADKRGGIEGKVTETKARHILVATNEIRNEEETLELARQLSQQLAEGADFATLARTHSDDPGSALSGGELGWMAPGKLVPEFQTVMDQTDIGQVSQPFQSSFGWHILEVMDRREKDLSREKASSLAQRAIAENKYDDELNNWLQELRDNSFVEIK